MADAGAHQEIGMSAVAGSLRRSWRSSAPLMPGIMRSRTMQSGVVCSSTRARLDAACGRQRAIGRALEVAGDDAGDVGAVVDDQDGRASSACPPSETGDEQGRGRGRPRRDARGSAARDAPRSRSRFRSACAGEWEGNRAASTRAARTCNSACSRAARARACMPRHSKRACASVQGVRTIFSASRRAYAA